MSLRRHMSRHTAFSATSVPITLSAARGALSPSSPAAHSITSLIHTAGSSPKAQVTASPPDDKQGNYHSGSGPCVAKLMRICDS
ncbi:hypothetical protein E2C01_012474 [Portunus trituberculatus]|uniref:Uncharacterized protein n=1 Tax=Portunus trituberculatus TaxID=210409 RepID=A0A5B7DE35_PORTR|nr:hypothetical protein [Portunus trituberculatus]